MWLFAGHHVASLPPDALVYQQHESRVPNEEEIGFHDVVEIRG